MIVNVKRLSGNILRKFGILNLAAQGNIENKIVIANLRSLGEVGVATQLIKLVPLRNY